MTLATLHYFKKGWRYLAIQVAVLWSFSATASITPVVIEFNSMSAEFNNVIELYEMTEEYPNILFILNVLKNNTGLADSRAQALVEALGEDRSVTVGYRLTRRVSEEDVAVMHAFSDEAQVRDYMDAATGEVLIAALNGYFVESDVRQWRAQVDSELVSVVNNSSSESQLRELVKHYGWRVIDIDGSLKAESVKAVPMVFDTVTVYSVATESEIKNIIEAWLGHYDDMASKVTFEFVDSELVVLIRGRK